MIRVLHVLGAMNMGGIESFIMNTYRVIDRNRVQFDFLVNDEENKYAQEIGELGGHIYFIPPRNRGIKAYKTNIDRFFTEHREEFQAVHLHAASLSSVYVLVAAKRYHIRTRIIHAHSTSIKGSKLHYVLHIFNKLRLKKIATHYFACSDKAQHWMFDYTGRFAKSEVINNGILMKDFAYDEKKRGEIRKQLGIESDEIAICHVGSLAKVKNQSFLIDIFLQLKTITPHYKLFMIGDGPLKSQLQEKIESLKIEDSVTFLGIRKDVHRLMQGFDCMVFPSLFEGLPVALVEVQASDLQVICSDTISGMAKISDDTTFLSLSLSASDWAREIDKKLKGRKRKDNTELIQKKGFSCDTVTKKLEKIYLD